VLHRFPLLASATLTAWRRMASAGVGVWVLAAVLGHAPGGLRAEGVTSVAPAASATGPTLPAANVLARQARQRTSARFWRTDGNLATDAADDALPWSNDPQLIEQGRRLYLDGVRSDGQPLVGLRLDGQVRLAGAAAACALCHRRSGLGAVEGPNQISPISGRYLFDQDRRALVNMNLRARKSFNQRHEPYTLDTLAQALRSGRHESGRALDPLMPRYELGDTDVLALASYLRRLSNAWSPGVADKQVSLATIITPDVDPERKRIFLATLNGIVAQKNGNLIHGQRTMSSGAEMALQTDRSWDMQVWELSGPPASWRAQLERLYAVKPVFAVASGLGAGDWAPVHGFCEQRGVPCWFPSVAAVPAASPGDFYSVYFSRGIQLEADVLARHLDSLAEAVRKPGRVLQVAGDDGVAAPAVAALRTQLADGPYKTSEFRLGAHAGTLAGQLAALGANDSVVFWLTPTQLKALERLPVPKAKVYVSASLGGGDKLPLAGAWRAAARMVYPYQLPELRQRGMTVFREFMRIRHLAVEDELLQSEVYFALNYLNDTLVDMLDNVHRDHLLERGENMLSLREAAKAEDEMRELSLPKSNLIAGHVKPLREMPQRMVIPRAVPRPAPAAVVVPVRGVGALAAAAADADANSTNGDAAVARASGAPQSTNAYPRLSLGQSQRHASKGAYIVRFGGAAGAELQAESDWIIP
jgi:hypothetical protein